MSEHLPPLQHLHGAHDAAEESLPLDASLEGRSVGHPDLAAPPLAGASLLG